MQEKVLPEEIKEKLKEIFLQVAEKYDFEITEQQVMSDHVYLFLSAPPRYSPARLVNIIKSISRNEIFREFPDFARKCWSRKLWADGYFVRAVGDKVTADEIQKYVRYQTKEKKGIQLDLLQEKQLSDEVQEAPPLVGGEDVTVDNSVIFLTNQTNNEQREFIENY